MCSKSVFVVENGKLWTEICCLSPSIPDLVFINPFPFAREVTQKATWRRKPSFGFVRLFWFIGHTNWFIGRWSAVKHCSHASEIAIPQQRTHCGRYAIKDQKTSWIVVRSFLSAQTTILIHHPSSIYCLPLSSNIIPINLKKSNFISHFLFSLFTDFIWIAYQRRRICHNKKRRLLDEWNARRTFLILGTELPTDKQSQWQGRSRTHKGNK